MDNRRENPLSIILKNYPEITISEPPLSKSVISGKYDDLYFEIYFDTPNEFLLIISREISKGPFDTPINFLNILAKQVGFQPLCEYKKAEHGSSIYIEWNNIMPIARLRDIANTKRGGYGLGGFLDSKSIRLFNGKDIDNYLDINYKETRKYGEDPCNIRFIEEFDSLDVRSLIVKLLELYKDLKENNYLKPYQDEKEFYKDFLIATICDRLKTPIQKDEKGRVVITEELKEWFNLLQFYELKEYLNPDWKI